MVGWAPRLLRHEFIQGTLFLFLCQVGTVTAETLYVSSFKTDRILGYNTSGQYATAPNDPVLSIGAGSPLSQPTGVTFGPDGNLYAASFGTNQILKFNGQTGAYLSVFATTATHPMDIAFRPEGLVVVENTNTGSNDFVALFNATTGAHIGDSAHTLQSPQGMAFDSSGRLYVATYNNNTVERFNSTT